VSVGGYTSGLAAALVFGRVAAESVAENCGVPASGRWIQREQ
jgi:hypothetical protein